MADTNINFLFGTEANFIDDTKKPANDKGSVYFTTVDETKGYLYFGDGTNFLNIVPKLLSVANGGTGKTSLESGKALIGNGTDSVDFREITDNSAIIHINGNTNLITANTLANWNGAYNDDDDSAISHLGTVVTGTWSADTIALVKGGTGNTEFNNGGVIYKHLTAGKLVSSASGAKGTILDGNDGAPIFVQPTLKWDAGQLAGPTIKLTINGIEYKSPIPTANESHSGIVTAPPSSDTTSIQKFGGLKQFTRTLTTTTI